MKISYKGSLQRTMIIYFLMISFASLLIAAEFIYDTHRPALRTELTQNFDSLRSGAIQPSAAFKPIRTIINKAILMVVLSLVVVLILLTMFIRTVTEPLQHMIEVSKLVSAGDLSQTVDIRADNELAELGGTVNDLTSNLQEMILLARGISATVTEFSGDISDVLDSQEIDREKLEGLRKKVRHLSSEAKLINDIVKNCKFYGMEG
jgi:methyl-accepting chemotaxis protein